MPALGSLHGIESSPYRLGGIASEPFWDLTISLSQIPGFFGSEQTKVLDAVRRGLENIIGDAKRIYADVEKEKATLQFDTVNPEWAISRAETYLAVLEQTEKFLKRLRGYIQTLEESTSGGLFKKEFQSVYDAVYDLYHSGVDLAEDLMLVPHLQSRIATLEEQKKKARPCQEVLSR